jgi:hypothetical protein
LGPDGSLTEEEGRGAQQERGTEQRTRNVHRQSRACLRSKSVLVRNEGALGGQCPSGECPRGCELPR